jgi:hypothetical protein
MRGNAASEIAVRRDQGGGAARGFQRFAQRQCDHLCFLGGIGDFERADTGQPALRRRQVLPLGRVKGGRHGVRHRAAAHRRRIAPAAPAPALDLAAANAHAVEQQLEMELRVRFDRAAAHARDGIRLVRAERVPLALGHLQIERGDDDTALFEAGDHLKQIGNGRGSRRDSGRDDEAARRPLAPALRHGAEQAVAPLSQIDAAALGEQRRPGFEDHEEPIERCLPMQLQVGQFGRERAQALRVDLLDQQLIERAGEVAARRSASAASISVGLWRWTSAPSSISRSVGSIAGGIASSRRAAPARRRSARPAPDRRPGRAGAAAGRHRSGARTLR